MKLIISDSYPANGLKTFVVNENDLLRLLEYLDRGTPLPDPTSAFQIEDIKLIYELIRLYEDECRNTADQWKNVDRLKEKIVIILGEL